jgi:hypothetical protein
MDAPQRFLDRADVLRATVEQLRKDLSLAEADLPAPEVGEGAFEELRSAVHPVLEALQAKGAHALRAAMYRVDIPEAHFRRTMGAGGLHALAGETVLRTLQKVLVRMRFAGRF